MVIYFSISIYLGMTIYACVDEVFLTFGDRATNA
jgi:hypothetical protein